MRGAESTGDKSVQGGKPRKVAGKPLTALVSHFQSSCLDRSPTLVVDVEVVLSGVAAKPLRGTYSFWRGVLSPRQQDFSESARILRDGMNNTAPLRRRGRITRRLGSRRSYASSANMNRCASLARPRGQN